MPLAMPQNVQRHFESTGDSMKKLVVAACLILTSAGTMVTASPVLAQSVTSEAAGREASVIGCQTRSIQSLANDKYVSAEFGWSGDNYGMLRARGTKVGPWEKFSICYNGRNHTIQSLANGKYVSAEFGWSGANRGMLRARTSKPGTWERFHIASCGTGCVSIQNLAVSSNRYVSAELGNKGDKYGMLRARGAGVGPWEKFRIR
ncbi:fascin domain-containing protein [Streptosporangium sp. CA-115845]|uniref:fascin domain-containing protein n=1 Tax=Streptosporangium sp. CA-115845 TaxID=3240071 RepID=UPI003D92C7FE